MHASARTIALSTWLFAACATTEPFERPSATIAPATLSPPESSGMYGAEEALRDVLSSPLEHVGTGTWPGNGRMHACAFRNQRVIVVNVYCGVEDGPAFRVEVLSPQRGRVRIYAESKAPVSEQSRASYFSFMVESEPPAPGSALPPPALPMSFSALQTYDERRQAAYLPACYGGTERHSERSGCLGPLSPQATTWMAQHHTFLENASDDWVRVVRELRALATRYGRDPE